jgi:hypothetical protein
MSVEFNREGYTVREAAQIIRYGIKAARSGELERAGRGKWERKADKIVGAAAERKAEAERVARADKSKRRK